MHHPTIFQVVIKQDQLFLQDAANRLVEVGGCGCGWRRCCVNAVPELPQPFGVTLCLETLLTHALMCAPTTQVTTPDIQAGSAVVHLLNKVLLPEPPSP